MLTQTSILLIVEMNGSTYELYHNLSCLPMYFSHFHPSLMSLNQDRTTFSSLKPAEETLHFKLSRSYKWREMNHFHSTYKWVHFWGFKLSRSYKWREMNHFHSTYKWVHFWGFCSDNLAQVRKLISIFWVGAKTLPGRNNNPESFPGAWQKQSTPENWAASKKTVSLYVHASQYLSARNNFLSAFVTCVRGTLFYQLLFASNGAQKATFHARNASKFVHKRLTRKQYLFII